LGDSVVITFTVDVNNGVYPGVISISNQGIVSGSNFNNILTGDPDATGHLTPTVTPLINVLEQVPPTITCPADQNVFFTAICDYTLLDYTAMAATSDNCSAVTVTQSPLVGTVITATTTITLTADDGNGNTATCTFDVIPTDNISPTITCPVDQNVFFSTACDYTLLDYTAMATTSDNCSAVTVTQSPLVGTVITATTTITLTADDGNGNNTTCDFNLVITDSINPVLSVLTDIQSCLQVISFNLPSATDNCIVDSIVQITGLPSNSSFPVGVTTNTFVAYDNWGNTDTMSFDIIIHSVPELSYNSSNVSCFGFADGIIDVDTQLGAAPFNYLWSNSEITEDVNGLAPGTYSMVVTDLYLCQDTIEVIITEPNELGLDLTQTNVSCYGLNDGALDVTPFGGTTQYSYNWTTLETSSSITNLPPALYGLILTDDNGCTIDTSFTITEPDSLIADFLVSQFTDFNISQMGACDGFIEISPQGGSIPYTYDWTNGLIGQDEYDLCAGIYIIEVMDINGCEIILEIELTELIEVIIPQGISPNGDGKNDVLIIDGVIEYPENEMIIYNRWGDVVYRASPYPNDWDGTPTKALFGDKVTDGSYYYTFKLSPNSEQFSGYIVVKR